MSLLLTRRIPKVAYSGKSLIRRGLRLLTTTTTSSLPTPPYLLLPMDVVRDYPGGKVANLNFYDLGNKKRVTLPEQRIPESIHLSRTIGSSRGWLVLMNEDDFTVHLTNIFHPSAPTSTHKVISLPPLLPLPLTIDPSEYTPLSELVRNVSLSSSPEEEDCVVAIKFWGSCLSFCRLSGKSSWLWTHIDHLPSKYQVSCIIYSNAASMFYLTPLTATIKNLDTHYRKSKHEFFGYKDNHGFYPLQLGPFEPPENLSLSTLLGRSFSFRNKFLVETPSGDIFIIMWYMNTGNELSFLCNKELDILLAETKRFELYKHDMVKAAESYVEDIGDLCIFFGKNEPFCVSASMYPGLEPNSIYFTGKNQICMYDIATHTIHRLPHQETLLTPFWLPPIPPK